METNQYKTDADADEFVHLINLFHTFYKREYNLPTSANFFDPIHGLKEMQEFKKQTVENKDAYCELYNEKLVKELLIKYKKIYYLTVNGQYAYTSNNVLKIITTATTYNLSNWDIKSETFENNISRDNKVALDMSKITNNVSKIATDVSKVTIDSLIELHDSDSDMPELISIVNC